jgi:endonuclease/exonuclease/phosphatase family metal-dependent hydrolase
VGESFKAVISGLLANAGDGKTTYSVVDRDAADWVSISQDGTITGTPTDKSVSKFVVVATGSDGTNARLPITIPVADSQAPLVEELKVMTFNIWMGGKNVKDSHRKQVNFLAESNVDIVGLQESDEGDSSRLAHALGWHGWKGKESRDVSIISRYPIVEHFSGTSAAGAVRIAADGNDSQVIVWNAHLGYDPYGPYDFCFSRFDDDTVLEREKESGRTPQITEIVDRMRAHIDDYANIPVILTGDFNAPSHLDWTDKTADQHCGIGAFDWPSSVLPTDAGLVDSFREMHPDPLAEPGITWSPIYKDNEGRDEPMDRIDFVYHRGMETLSSEVLVVGDPAAEPNHADNEWPSDHAAVMTTFKIPSKR